MDASSFTFSKFVESPTPRDHVDIVTFVDNVSQYRSFFPPRQANS